MALEAPLDISRPQPDDEQTSTLFAYEARRQARVVIRLVGSEADVHRIRVAAEIYPVDAPETNEPQRRFYDFPTRQKAQAFTDEALLALEYLGCTVTDTGPSRPGTVASAEFAA
jgi:hypothetical protein